MQIFFKQIVAGDLDAVRARIDKTPSSVALVASASPKMYAGQSPLQLAYRHDRFEIAALLLEHGADPARPAEGNLGMPLAEYFRAEALGRILSVDITARGIHAPAYRLDPS